MAFLEALSIFICAVLTFSESKFVDTLSKCSIKDGECQAALVSSSLQAIHKTGIPELGVPPVDPIEFKDITVSILDLVQLTAVEGTAKGIKNCVVDSFKSEIEKGHSEMKLTCNNLILKSKYKLSGSSPIVKNLLGGAGDETGVSGEGTGKVKIEKLQFRFDYFYDMERKQDGDVYFHCRFNKTVYDYEFLGRVTFAADSIFLGGVDATIPVLEFLNENSKFIMATFGRTFMDKAMELVYLYTHKFFDVVPAKYFIIEDLSEYVKS